MQKSIRASELRRLLDDGSDLVIIDVRTLDEYLMSHIPTAIHIPIASIESGAYIPEPNKILVTACGKGGGRSEKAADYLRDHFTNTSYFLEGGTLGWE